MIIFLYIPLQECFQLWCNWWLMNFQRCDDNFNFNLYYNYSIIKSNSNFNSFSIIILKLIEEMWKQQLISFHFNIPYPLYQNFRAEAFMSLQQYYLQRGKCFGSQGPLNSINMVIYAQQSKKINWYIINYSHIIRHPSVFHIIQNSKFENMYQLTQHMALQWFKQT